MSGVPPLASSAAGGSQSSAGSSLAPVQAQEPDLSVIGGTFVYDGYSHEAIGSALGENDFVVSGTFSYTYNGSPDAPIDPGTYAVVATFTSSDPNFTNGTANTTLTITPAVPLVTVVGGTFPFDFNPHPAMATAIGVDGQSPVAGGFAFTYNGSPNAPVNPGTYSVVATFTSSDSHYTNSSATGTIVIPDPTIPGGVAVTGTSPTSVAISWNPVLEPSGGTPTYNVYERVFHPGHGGGRGGIVPSYYTYNLVASGSTATTAVVSGLAPASPGGTAASHSYVVSSLLNGVESTRSAVGVGAPLYAPSLGYFLLGGALWSGSFPVNVTVGQTQQISLQSHGNEAPTFSVASGPSCVSIDPQTGVISISPSAADVGTFSATFAATNSLGSATSAPLAVHVLALPTVLVTGGTFAFDGATHSASAVAYGADGVTPLAGTMSFLYAPAAYPFAMSTAPYAMPGSYLVQATFNSNDPNYGNAVGIGSLVISPATPTLIVSDGSFVFDGSAHGATAVAVGIDGVTPVAGSFEFTYDGLSTEPTAAGTHAVLATFTSDDPSYASAAGGGTIVIGAAADAPSTTVTVGTTATFSLTGTTPGSGPTHIVNNSTAETGLFVTGANQVGEIEGTGNTLVDSGSSLVANRIVQGSLVIGGSPDNPSVVTIAASDAAGNPLASAGVSASPSVSGAVLGAAPSGPAATAPDQQSIADHSVSMSIAAEPISHAAQLPPQLPSALACSPAMSLSSVSPAVHTEVPPSAILSSIRMDFATGNQPNAVDTIFEAHGISSSVDDSLLDLIGLGIERGLIS